MIKEKTNHKRTQRERFRNGNTVYLIGTDFKIDLSKSFKVVERDEEGNVLLSDGNVVPSWKVCRWTGTEAR